MTFVHSCCFELENSSVILLTIHSSRADSLIPQIKLWQRWYHIPHIVKERISPSMKGLLPWLNTVGWWKVSAGSHCTHVPFGEQTNDLRLIVQEDALSFLMTHGNHQLNLGLVLAFMCFSHTVVVNAGGDHREALKLDYFCMNTGQWFLNSAIPLVDRITTSTPLGAWYGHRGCTPPAPLPL